VSVIFLLLGVEVKEGMTLEMTSTHITSVRIFATISSKVRLLPFGFDTGRVGATCESSKSTRRRKFVCASRQKHLKPAIRDKGRNYSCQQFEFLFFFFFLVSWGGVRLGPLGTSATIWPIVPAPDDG
jgi:hypothetical protein